MKTEVTCDRARILKKAHPVPLVEVVLEYKAVELIGRD